MLRRRALGLLSAPALAAATGRASAQAGTVLRFSWWGGAGRHEATLKAIALFERRHPGVKVKAEYMGFNGYLERLTTQIAGGSEPDVMQINWAWLAMFSRRGKGFTDLSPYRAQLAMDQFPDEDLRMGVVADRLNAMPVGYTARILLWNETSFARAGLTPPRNWDELFASGPAFRAKLGDAHFPIDGELYDMILLSQAWVQQKHGVAFIDPATQQVAMSPAAALEWVQVYQRLVREHVCTPLRLRASLGGAEKPTEQQQDWVLGRWAGNYTWDSVIALRGSTVKAGQTLTLGDFPRLPGARDSGMFGRPTLMYAVGRNTRQAELAAQLIGFLSADPEAAAILGRTRGIPAARSAMAVLQRDNRIPPLELRAHQQIQVQKQAGAIPLPSPLFEHARMQKFMREVFETIAYGKTSDADAARRLVEEGNGLLRRIR